MEKYGRAGQATYNKMVHAHCMLDTYGYKYTLSICSTFFTFFIILHVFLLLCIFINT
jgi:hypothetical protein